MKILSIKKKNSVYYFVSVIFIVILWCIISSSDINGIIFPSPSAVFHNLINLLKTRLFYIQVLSTLKRCLVALLLVLLLGSSLGLISGYYEKIYILLKPLVVSIKSLPFISIILICLVYLKPNNIIILCSVLMCFPSVYEELYFAVKKRDKKILDMFYIFRIKKNKRFFSYDFPSFLPYFALSLVQVSGMIIKVSVACEAIILPKSGIGRQLLLSQSAIDINSLIAWSLVIIFISFLFDLFLVFLADRLKKKYEN